jgi:hypothetical protein
MRALALHPSLTRLCIAAMPTIEYEDVGAWKTTLRSNLRSLRVEQASSLRETDGRGRPTPQLAYLATFPNLRELCLDSRPSALPMPAFLKLLSESAAVAAGRLRLLRLQGPVGAWFRQPQPKRRSSSGAVTRDATLWMSSMGGCVMAIVSGNRQPLTSPSATVAVVATVVAAATRFLQSPQQRFPSSIHAPIWFLNGGALCDNVASFVFDATRDRSSAPALCGLLASGCVVALNCSHKEPSEFTLEDIGAAAGCFGIYCLCRTETSEWRVGWTDVRAAPIPVDMHGIPNAVDIRSF